MSTYPAPELFRNFPELRERLPWVPLARATRVERLCRLESHLNAASIWVKRDDETSPIYGGDKARKLEFVFGDLLRHGARRVLAFGAVGSRDCLAVTAFAHQFRVRPILALVRQPHSLDVQRSLEIEHELGAELHRLDGGPRAAARLFRSVFGAHPSDDEPRLPYVLWPHRLAVYGALGYVNAAYELKRQINVGLLPEPERIYVPVGSGATAAGLAVGCVLANIPATIVGVVGATGGRRGADGLARRAARALRSRTKRLPTGAASIGRIELRREFSGTSDDRVAGAHQTAGLLHDLEALDLNPMYGARAVMALVDDVRHGRATGPVLLWHTHPADSFARHRTVDAGALPREFREFFVAR